MKLKLPIKTFDGSLLEFRVKPQYKETSVQFDITYYDEYENSVRADLIFENVISIDFGVNYFDNFIGTESFGFYEIEDTDIKQRLLEKIFEK